MSEGLAKSRDPLIGALVDGRYLVQSVIGRGGMGVVYAAVHEELERAVAVKVLNPAWASDPDAAARFLREARVASSLSHANIIDVWDLGRLPDGRPFLVMPRIAGEDLGTMLAEEGPQHPRRVVKLLEGVAAALDLIHDKGFVHRDIKPENLLRVLREDGSEAVLVLDFGIAAAVLSESRFTKDGVLCGTPDFLPPEVVSGELPDRRGDVYALATVAFELLTGRLPFQGVNPFQLLTLKLAKPAPSLSHMSGRVFPQAFEHVVARGLARRPADRYATAGEFVHALATAAEQAHDELPDLSTADTARHSMRQSAFIRRPQQPEAEAPIAAPSRRASPRQVLIVEDDVDLEELLSPLGKRRSYKTGLYALVVALIVGGVYWTLREQRSPAAAEPVASATPAQPSAPATAAAPAAQLDPATTLDPATLTTVPPHMPAAAAAGATLVPVSPPPAASPPAIVPPTEAIEPVAEREPARDRADRRSRRREKEADDERADDERADVSAAIVPAVPEPPPQSVLSIAPAAPDPPEASAPEPPVLAPAPAPDGPSAAAAAEQAPAPPQLVQDRARAKALTVQATDAMLQGQLTAALTLYQRAVQADRGHAAAWRGRGLVLQQLGRAREAVQAFREFLRLEPQGAQSEMIRARLRSIEQANGL